jgi:hypothetical protein
VTVSKLPRPPAGRLSQVPRIAPDDKPQEVSLAINPCDPTNAILSFHQVVGVGDDHSGIPVDNHVAWTDDGGQTWQLAGPTSHPDYRVSIDATVAFDRRGHAYLTYIGIDRMSFFTPTTRHGNYILRSVDGGRSWEPPLTLIERPETDGGVFEHIPCAAPDNHESSPFAGNVYLAWERIFPDNATTEMVFTRSTDGGETWLPPRVLSKHDTRIGAQPVIGADGTLYIMSFCSWPKPTSQLFIKASRDGGETFDEANLIVEPDFALFVERFNKAGGGPSMAAHPKDPGRLIVTWGDKGAGDRDILCITSDDHGRTWSVPVRVNDDPLGNGRDQVMEQLAVDPLDGSVYMLFYDRRSDPNNVLATITLARSTDWGKTWTNYAWSEQAYDPTIGPLGEYLGLDARGGKVYAAWVENFPLVDPASYQAEEPVDGSGLESDPRQDKDFTLGPTAICVGTADFGSPA